MSFDPGQMRAAAKVPSSCAGIVAAKYRPHPYWDLMPGWMRHGMGYLVTALTARPQFVAYAVADLPALAPLLARHVFGLPLLTWAVRTLLSGSARTLGRPDDFRRFSAMNEAQMSGKASRGRRPSVRDSELRIQHRWALSADARPDWDGCANPATRSVATTARLKDQIKKTTIIHLFHTIFCRRWRSPDRSAAAPAGRCSTCWSKRRMAR